jgi:hypothetical protein
MKNVGNAKSSLLFDHIVVGEITNAFDHQGTWFGEFSCVLPEHGDDATRRLREFIIFCQDWFARCNSDESANASEFDQFGDLVTAGKWQIRTREGYLVTLESAPMFIDGLQGEITW